MFAICNLAIVPLRSEPSDRSELVTQVLFGEPFTILEQQKNWSKIELAFDNYQGWIDNKQYQTISASDFYSSKMLHEKWPEILLNTLQTKKTTCFLLH